MLYVFICVYEASDPRVRLIQQETRSGKASAVNLFLKNVNSDVIILESADTIPAGGSIDALVRPSDESEI